ncbi:MAG: glycosyltransferase family 39 protein [Acidobacteriota bacterium]|nr:glycosyltransferase family 39 protein [Acidobacteriota bacterium]
MDKVVGMFQDDAWYPLLGKALATGQGYTLINSPTPGILPLYPPAFPFLLSLVFRISTQFPQNLWLLKSVSIVAMLLTGWTCYHYFIRYRNLPNYLALAIGAVVALSPGLVFMATSSLMSECVFALTQMATLIAVERCVLEKDGGRFWLYASLAAAAASWSFLTRSMAAGLVLAAVVYLIKERLFKSVLVFAACVALIAGSWVVYSRAKAPTPEQRAEVNSYIVRPYTEQFWDRIAGHEAAGRISMAELPERFWNNVASIASSDIGGIVTPSFFPALNQGMAERSGFIQPLISLLVFVLLIVGFISVVRERLTYAELALPFSLLIIIIWPFPPYRFLLPSVPLLLFYFLIGCKLVLTFHSQRIQATNPRQRWVGTTVLAGLLFLLTMYGNISYLVRKNSAVASQRPRWVRIFDDNEAIMKWTAENVARSDAIATANPALVNLYTGNKTTTFDNPAGNWDRWSRLGIRYLVHISPIRLPEPDPNEAKYRIIHREGNLNLRVVDFGPAEARPKWGAGSTTSTRIN